MNPLHQGICLLAQRVSFQGAQPDIAPHRAMRDCVSARRMAVSACDSGPGIFSCAIVELARVVTFCFSCAERGINRDGSRLN